MAIADYENENNGARMQAIAQRVSRQIGIEMAFRAALLAIDQWEVPVPAATIADMKSTFATLRSEVITLENNIDPNE